MTTKTRSGLAGRWAMAFAVAIAAAMTGCGGDRGDQARQIGDIHLRNNKLQEAEASYTEALAANPANARAQLGLANVYRMRDRLPEAAAAFDKAIELDPALEEAYVQAVPVNLALGETDAAQALAAKLRATNELPGALLEASIARATGDIAGAASILEGLKASYPDSVPVRVGLAIDYMASDRPAEAEAELREVLDTIDPGSVQARMALIDVYRAQGKLAEIEAELRSSVDQAAAEAAQDPSNTDAANRAANFTLQLALTLLQAGRAEEALGLVEPIVRNQTDSPWANYVYGSCLAELGRRGEALQALQAAATALPEEPQIARRLALVKAQSEGAAPAPAATTAAAPAPASPAAPAPSGRMAEDWQSLWNAGSLQTLVRNRASYPADAPNLSEILALSAMIIGDRPLAVTLVAQTPPASPLRALHDAVVAEDGAKLRDAMASWTETDPARQAIKANAEGFVYSITGLRARALQTLLTATRDHPGNGVAYYNIAAMYNAAGMPRFAAHALLRLLQIAPNAIETRALLYQTQRRAGMDAEARATAEATYGLFPDSRDAILNLASTYLDDDEGDLALSVLGRGAQALKNDGGVVVAYAAALLRTGAVAEAGDLLAQHTLDGLHAARGEELKAYIAAHDGDWAAVETLIRPIDEAVVSGGGRLMLASALARKGDKPAALAALGEPSPENQAFVRRTALLAKALGREDVAADADATAFVSAIADAPESIGQYAYALACMEASIYRDAYDALIALEERTGPQAPIATLLLSSLAGATTYPDRVAKAEAVVARYPQAFAAIGLSAVYAREGEAVKQGQTLKAAAAANPGSEQAWVAYALFAGNNGQTAEALAAYDTLIALGVDRPEVFNNYAYLLLESGGDTAKALDYARRAAQGPLARDGQVIHTLGRALLEDGDTAEAEKALARAAEMMPGDPTVLLDLGRAFAANGREADGKTLARQALMHADQLGLEFPRRAEAEALAGDGAGA